MEIADISVQKNGITPLPEIPRKKRSSTKPIGGHHRSGRSLFVPKLRSNAANTKSHLSEQMANIGSMEDIQGLFKETIAEFMENGLEAELDDELGYSRYDYKNKDTDNSRNGHSSKTLRTSFGYVGWRK